MIDEDPMTETVDDLILDLLEWLTMTPRPYSEVLDAWRTSCPRLPVWEEANDRGYVERHRSPGVGPFISVSAVGAEHLRTHRPAALRALGRQAGSSSLGGQPAIQYSR
jgi:hypothetical protein